MVLDNDAAAQGTAGSFDSHRPPRQDLLDDCVHCGFCLPTCPTYLLDGQEMDSPRGRIYLMDLARRSEVELDQTFSQHIDSCLGCLACVTSCPSGVQYDLLLEATRPQVERNVPRGMTDRIFRRLIFALFPHPRRLRVAALLGVCYRRLGFRALVRRSGLLNRAPARLRALESLLPPVTVRSLFSRVARFTPASGSPRLRVAMLTGCAQRVFFSEVNAATVRVLTAEGCEVLAPPGQPCCGALNMHAGLETAAIARAKQVIAAFEKTGADVTVVNVAGCGSSMKEYGNLLSDDPEFAGRAARFAATVRDISELLAELEPVATRHRIDARVAYHDACHLANAQGIRQQPRDVLRAIPGLELVPIPEAEICCGSAGVYNLVQPEAGEALGERKAENIRSVRPDVIATANAGCLLQIRRFLDETPLLHPVEIVDASIRGTGLLSCRVESPRGSGNACREIDDHHR